MGCPGNEWKERRISETSISTAYLSHETKQETENRHRPLIGRSGAMRVHELLSQFRSRLRLFVTTEEMIAPIFTSQSKQLFVY